MPPPMFPIMKDGDLWYFFWAVAQKRTPTSILISKVKGHAELKDVQHDAELLRLKRGNDHADHIATHTYELSHGPSTTDISGAYHG
eukprot:3132286-Karenia_brevis.AAC.1